MNNENSREHEYRFSIKGGIEFALDNGFEFGRRNGEHREEETISLLNSRKDIIADRISRVLEGQLPASFGGNVKVITSLEFGNGSITWLGFVTVLDWVGKFVDSVTFIQMISNAVQFATNRVISRELARNSIQVDFQTMSTAVMPDFVPTSQTDYLYRSLIVRQDEQIRLLRGLTRNSENVLRYIGQLQRRNTAFRAPNLLPGYPNYSFQRPVWLSRDTFVTISLILIVIIQIINYFGIETIRDWFVRLANSMP